MKNLESFKDFKSDEITMSETIFGGQDIPTTWTDGWNTGADIYDSSRHRITYL